MDHLINVALAQIAPVWLDKKATLDKILVTLVDAKKQDAELVVFGEGLLPSYPF
jgi:nitrilase